MSLSVIITLSELNSLYCSLKCKDYNVKMEIASHFTYMTPGYENIPDHLKRGWDGTKSIYNPNNDIFFNGSVGELKRLGDMNGWLIVDNRTPKDFSLDDEEATEFYDSLDLKYTVRDHQNKAFRSIISNDGYGFYISPTSSGKSFIAFLTAQYFRLFEQKTLIVVPTIHLVGQMNKDFQKYSTVPTNVKMIKAGVDKEIGDHDIVVTTWQSIVDMDQEWFDQFTCFIGDEGHGFTAKSLQTILSKTGNVAVRVAMTGTLRGCPVARMQLEAYFGSIMVVTTYKELRALGYISDLKIRIMLFKHDPKITRTLKFGKGSKGYKAELEYLSLHEGRNNFIVNMTKNLKGNVLVMVKDLTHGKILQDLISQETGREIRFINGTVKSDIRLDAMEEMEQNDGVILIATYKSFGTGTSIENLHHLILGDMIKSDETVIQTLGRLLRIHDSKEYATLWDLADDMRARKNSKSNFSRQHMIHRCEAYDDIGYDYTIHERSI